MWGHVRPFEAGHRVRTSGVMQDLAGARETVFRKARPCRGRQARVKAGETEIVQSDVRCQVVPVVPSAATSLRS